MERLSDFPYFPLEFTKEASVHDPAQITALKGFLAQGGATDLIIISHGWNNNMAEAKDLYRLFFANLRALIDSGAPPGLAQRKLAVLGVLWPSKRFEEKELIPSGAAGVSSLTGMVAMKAKLADLKGTFDSPHADRTLDELQQLLPKLEDSSATRKEFIEKVRSLIRKGTAEEEDGSKSFFATPPGEVLEKLSKPVSFTVAHAPAQAGGAAAIGTGGAATIGAGGAAGLGDFFSGIWSGVRNVLNYTTYYQMKERAGTVGADGLNPLLREIASQQPGIKLHLVGHSFGGRLITAAVAGADGTSPLKISSLSLLQAAFSHYGFSHKWDGASDGAFRRVLTGQAVSGPTIITCTDNDKAVGLAYPIASLLAGQVAAGIGDKNDKYGGIGRNGAQKTPEAVNESLLDVNKPYSLTNGRMHNLNTTHFIRDHGDVHNAQVVYAVASAIAAAT